MEDLLYKDITYDIRGACFSVWKNFAGAFKEKISERALAIELQKKGRKIETQKKIELYYMGEKVGCYIPDLIVDSKVLVEIKSKEFLTEQDYDQFWKYLKGSEYKLGLLINFGAKKLEIKRVVYDTAREKVSALAPRRYLRQSAERGFTLMEIVVSTVIFAVLSTALMSLFNYTLKINRKSDALRQTTQALRSLVETLVKEVHNGQIDYGVLNGLVQDNVGSCPKAPPGVTGGSYNGNDIYSNSNNSLGIINSDGDRECIYLSGKNIILKKEKVANPQNLNSSNTYINELKFYIRPKKDPYCGTAPCVYPKVQPFVFINMNMEVKLTTGETVSIYYQTTITTNKYDVPH